MKSSIISILALFILAACGVDTSKLQDQQAKDKAAAEQEAKDKAAGPKDAPPQAAPKRAQAGTSVDVDVSVHVSVSSGSAAAGEPAEGPQLLRFAGGAFGYFMPDGSFAAGLALAQWGIVESSKPSLDYCRFEAQDCRGRCIVASEPVKDSLFSNGSAFFRALENETDYGRAVVGSVWRNGACESEAKTLQHSFRPKYSWVLDAGDSTVPSEHEAAQ